MTGQGYATFEIRTQSPKTRNQGRRFEAMGIQITSGGKTYEIWPSLKDGALVIRGASEIKTLGIEVIR